MARLVVSLQGVALRVVDLSQDEITIGRRSRNHVVMDTLGVSGEHAVVRRCGAEFYIEDLGSTNGTLVNGQPVRKRVLHSGDSIEIGEYRLTFLADRGKAPTTNIVGHASLPLPPGNDFDEAPKTIRIQRTNTIAEAPARNGPRLRILSGAHAGREYSLRKVMTRLGRPGVGTAVITRSPGGYFIEHHRGGVFPKVNGVEIGANARPLANDDVIEVAGVELRFVGDAHSAAPVPRPEAQAEQPASDQSGKERPQHAPLRAGPHAKPTLPHFATDQLRNLFHIRTPRTIPRPGPRPNPGARVCLDDLRLTVQAGMSSDLWRWLQEAGWREITYRPDRRHYCDVPTECVSELLECPVGERRHVLDAGVENAREGRLPFLNAILDSTR